jgi:rhamnosyl/mannosyltransferase
LSSLTARGNRCAALVHDHTRSLRGGEESFETLGGPVRLVRTGTWFRAYFTPISPGFPIALRRLLRRFEPDLVHLHLPNPSACWILALPGAYQVPWIVHWHSDVVTVSQGPVMRLLYAFYRPLERRLLRRAAAIVATSSSYLETSESLRAWPEKCHVVPLGLDPQRFKPPPDQGPAAGDTESPLQALAIGRLTYYKGFGYLLRALALVDSVQLHLVGEGELELELRGLASQLGVQQRVHFHGALDDEALAGRLVDCDCLCLPSIERTEAFGLVLLEAMRFRRPAICSRVSGSGMTWVVEDGVTGLVVPPRNVPALAAALRRLRDDRPLARRLGEAGGERFATQFSIDRSVDALQEVYGQVLERGHG